MKSIYIEKTLEYNATNLTSFWAEKEFGIMEDSIIAFVGPFIETKKNKNIEPNTYLHFIFEQFGVSKREMRLLQRLFVVTLLDSLEENFYRIHSDLYYDNILLSKSNAQSNLLSSCFHYSLIVENKNKLEKTIGLADLNFPVQEFAITVMQKFIRELESLNLLDNHDLNTNN